MTIVYDNNEHDPKLRTAWGFACVIQGFEKTILFDTGGRGSLLLRNMEKLGIHPKEIDMIVLSHNHGDHTGGLDAVLEENSNVTIFMPRSFPGRMQAEARRAGAQVVAVKKPVVICEGVRSVGELGFSIKEQSLCLETKEGLVVITGCAHPGVVKIAMKAKELEQKPIHLVIGGFHMGGAARGEIQSVITGLGELGVKKVAPCHCSGELTQRLMKEAFADGYLQVGVGARLVFQSDRKLENSGR